MSLERPARRGMGRHTIDANDIKVWKSGQRNVNMKKIALISRLEVMDAGEGWIDENRAHGNILLIASTLPLRSATFLPPILSFLSAPSKLLLANIDTVFFVFNIVSVSLELYKVARLGTAKFCVLIQVIQFLLDHGWKTSIVFENWRVMPIICVIEAHPMVRAR